MYGSIVISFLAFHQDSLPLQPSVALGRHGQGAGRQQTLKFLGDPISVFQNILTLKKAVFHRKPDGKRIIYPISILGFGSVFSPASAERSPEFSEPRSHAGSRVFRLGTRVDRKRPRCHPRCHASSDHPIKRLPRVLRQKRRRARGSSAFRFSPGGSPRPPPSWSGTARSGRRYPPPASL